MAVWEEVCRCQVSLDPLEQSKAGAIPLSRASFHYVYGQVRIMPPQ